MDLDFNYDYDTKDEGLVVFSAVAGANRNREDISVSLLAWLTLPHFSYPPCNYPHLLFLFIFLNIRPNYLIIPGWYLPPSWTT